MGSDFFFFKDFVIGNIVWILEVKLDISQRSKPATGQILASSQNREAKNTQCLKPFQVILMQLNHRGILPALRGSHGFLSPATILQVEQQQLS